MSPLDPRVLGLMLLALLAVRSGRSDLRDAVMLGCTLLFVGAGGWLALACLTVVALAAWGAGQAVARHPAAAGEWAALGVAATLAPLVLLDAWDPLAGALGALLERPVRPLGLRAPLGLSFYTLQAVGYVIDVRRGHAPAVPLRDFVRFFTFFPQLVAGPIERWSTLGAALSTPPTWDARRVGSGAALALWGAFVKTVLADPLGVYLARAFDLERPGGPAVWAAAVGSTVWIYADLSAYTDVARGLGRALGVELTANFARPWTARSTPELWARWHVSMTRWIRDYVLLPALGDAPGPLRYAGALLWTFGLMGLWHGFGWNYLLFGVWHAAWMLAYGAARPWVERASAAGAGPALALGHWAVVGVIGSLIFREGSPERLLGHLSRPPWDGEPDELATAAVVLGFTAITAGGLALAGALAPRVARDLPLRATAAALALAAIWVFAGSGTAEFAYFKF